MMHNKILRMTLPKLILMTKIIMFIKPRRKKHYICCFLQYQILETLVRMNDDD